MAPRKPSTVFYKARTKPSGKKVSAMNGSVWYKETNTESDLPIPSISSTNMRFLKIVL